MFLVVFLSHFLHLCFFYQNDAVLAQEPREVAPAAGVEAAEGRQAAVELRAVAETRQHLRGTGQASLNFYT